VVVQFSASVILIIAVVVIHQQLEFIQNKNLGFNPENVIAISTSGVQENSKNTALVNAFEQLPNVLAVTRAQGYPSSIGVSVNSIVKPNNEEGMSVNTNLTEHNIVDVLQLKVIAGQSLPEKKHESDSIVEVIINKTATDFLGLSPNDAIGKKVNVGLGSNTYIHGVVDDFNFASLHKPIGAYAFHNTARRGVYNYLLVRFNSDAMGKTLSQFENTFKATVQDSAFEYEFVDKNLELLYKKEQQMGNVSLLFSVLAIVVACLGLFALAAYMAEQRQKEIGIRKVFGASISKIVTLLSKEFLKLVVVSFAISFPLAYYFMNGWLQDFAYRINVSWTVFVIAGVLAVTIAFVTVGYQALKAAIANPIKSLKTE